MRRSTDQIRLEHFWKDEGLSALSIVGRPPARCELWSVMRIAENIGGDNAWTCRVTASEAHLWFPNMEMTLTLPQIIFTTHFFQKRCHTNQYNGVRPTAVGVAHYLMCMLQESDSEDSRYIKTSTGHAQLMLLYSKWNMEPIDDYYIV